MAIETTLQTDYPSGTAQPRARLGRVLFNWSSTSCGVGKPAANADALTVAHRATIIGINLPMMLSPTEPRVCRPWQKAILNLMTVDVSSHHSTRRAGYPALVSGWAP